MEAAVTQRGKARRRPKRPPSRTRFGSPRPKRPTRSRSAPRRTPSRSHGEAARTRGRPRRRARRPRSGTRRWVRPIPAELDMAKTGPLLCGGVTVFAPLLINEVRSTGRVGIVGIGGLGHMALQFANKWGCEVHAFTTSDSKEAEARQLGAHFVHNTRQDGALKKLARSLDLIISTVNVPLDVSGLLDTLAPKGRLHNVGAVLKPLEVPAFSLSLGQKSVSGSPAGSPVAIDEMLEFSARHSISPITETFRCRRSTKRWSTYVQAKRAIASFWRIGKNELPPRPPLTAKAPDQRSTSLLTSIMKSVSLIPSGVFLIMNVATAAPNNSSLTTPLASMGLEKFGNQCVAN